MITDKSVKVIMYLIMQNMTNNNNIPRMFKKGLLLLPCKPWGRVIDKISEISLHAAINYLYEKDCIQSKDFNHTIEGNMYKNYVIYLNKMNELFDIDMNVDKTLSHTG
jgi:hypothetical protein